MNKFEDLIRLQQEQLRHDKLVHRDILSLSAALRCKHMVLHFAKYVGALSQYPDDEKLHRVLVDTFIIAMSLANTLNVDLTARIREVHGVRSYDELAQRTRNTAANVPYETFVALAHATGDMAKACESLDHVEEFDVRGTLERGVVQVTCIVLAAFRMLGQDFFEQIRVRWEGIERKSIFSAIKENKNLEDTSVPVALVVGNGSR